jgi:hypothetical protein
MIMIFLVSILCSACNNTDTVIKSSEIKAVKYVDKTTSGDNKEWLGIVYTISITLNDPSTVDKIKVGLALTGDTKKIIGFDKFSSVKPTKNGDKFEIRFSDTRNTFTENDIQTCIQNISKDTSIFVEN